MLYILFGVVQYFFLMTSISFSYGDSGYIFASPRIPITIR
jgi:hypothetical protein